MERRGFFGFFWRPRAVIAVILAIALVAMITAGLMGAFRSGEYKRHAEFNKKSCAQIHQAVDARAQCVTLYFATTRNQRGAPGSESGGYASVDGFGNRYSDEIVYGRAEVTLPYLVSEKYPHGRKRGVIDFAQKKPPADTEETETLVALTTISKAVSNTRFYTSLKDAVGQNENAALLFIHGFNVDFDSAVIRTAQLAVDLTYDESKDPNNQIFEFGQPVLFSWPNGGVPFTYLDDQGAAEKSATQLEIFLDELTALSGVKTVNIIVHSMGNRVLVKALETFVQGYSNSAPGDIQFKIIHAAADVDKGVYDDVMNQIARKQFKAEYTVYASSEDSPLAFSRFINYVVNAIPFIRGRLGQIVNGDIYIRTPKSDKDIVTSIDATGFATDLYGHGYFSNAGNIISDISCNLAGEPPNKRALAPRKAKDGRDYWEADSSQCGECAIERLPDIASDAQQVAFREADASLSTGAYRAPASDEDLDEFDYYESEPPVQYKDCWDGSGVPVTAECPPQIVEESAVALDPLSFTIYFDYKSTDLTDDARTLIAEAAARMLQYDIAAIVVTGFADSVGSDAYNLGLSRRRARAVRDALIAEGVPADLIRVEARGEENLAGQTPSAPLSRTPDEKREPRSRRVEVVVTFE